MSTQVPPTGSPQPGPDRAPVAQAAPMARPAAASLPPKPAASPAIEAEEFPEAGISSSFVLFNVLPSYGISFVTHMIIVIIMALITVGNQQQNFTTDIVVDAPQDVEELKELDEEVVPEMILDPNVVTSTTSSEFATAATQNVVEPTVVVDTPSADLEAAAIQIELSDFGERTAPKNDLMKVVGAVAGAGLDGRGAAARGEFNVEAQGGTPDSEKAVLPR